MVLKTAYCSSASNDVSNMERKQYLDQIHVLVQTVQTLLDANIALDNKQKELQTEADCKIAGLQAQVDKLTEELQARRRKMHGKNRVEPSLMVKKDGMILEQSSLKQRETEGFEKSS